MPVTTGILTEYQLELSITGGKELETDEDFMGDKAVTGLVEVLKKVAGALQAEELVPGETLEIRITNASATL